MSRYKRHHEFSEVMCRLPKSIQDNWSDELLNDVIKPHLVARLTENNMQNKAEAIQELSFEQLESVLSDFQIELVDEMYLTRANPRSELKSLMRSVWHIWNASVSIVDRDYNGVIISNLNAILGHPSETHTFEIEYDRLRRMCEEEGVSLDDFLSGSST